MTLLLFCLSLLWNHPSVRLLGFGQGFDHFIPDPITDIIRNPAFLKQFDYDNPLFYTVAQPFENVDSVYLYDRFLRLDLFETAEPLSLMLLYPKVGIGFRLGAWTRFDEDRCAKWFYGQAGTIGAMNLGKYIKIGAEYDFSWNNQPDDRIFSPYVYKSVCIHHYENSNEFGFGVVVGNNKWQLSVSAKNNWEIDKYRAETSQNLRYWYYWPVEWPSRWSEKRTDLRILSNLIFKSSYFTIIIHFSHYYYKWFRRYLCWTPQFYYDYRETFSSEEPGVTFLYKPTNDMFIFTGMSYWRYGESSYVEVENVVIPVGFEKKLNSLLTLRFGDTFVITRNYMYWQELLLKNEINFGFDIKPYKKLTFSCAIDDPLKFRKWFFGLHFSL